MKAVLLNAPGDYRVTDVPDPDVGDGDILIRVRAATLCGTDLRILSGRKKKGVRFPSVIGHEFAGDILKTGPAVAGFKPGDRIAADPVVPCRSCAYCRTGMENVCLNRRAIGYEFDGAFAELLRIPAAALEAGNIRKLPDSLSYAAGALIEPLACVVNGQENVDMRLGDVVLVLGAGPIGLMHMLLAKASGAGLVVVSEPNPERRRQAAELGADIVVDPGAEDPGEVVRARTDGLGASVAILAIGVPALATAALGYVRKGGRVNLFAGFSTGDTAAIDVNLIHYNEIYVSGASALSRESYDKALGIIASGALPVDKLVTHRFPLDDFGKAVELARSGKAIKIAIENA